MNGTFIDKQFIVALKQRMRSSAQEPSPSFITTNNSNHWSKCGRFYLLWWAFKNENLTSPLLGTSHLREARAVAWTHGGHWIQQKRLYLQLLIASPSCACDKHWVLRGSLGWLAESLLISQYFDYRKINMLW